MSDNPFGGLNFYKPIYRPRRTPFDEVNKNRKYSVSHTIAQRVQYAHKTGKLIRSEFCEKCGISSQFAKIHSHHHDYSKPLEVIYLCVRCHFMEHPERAIRPAYLCYRCFGKSDRKWSLCADCRASQEVE